MNGNDAEKYAIKVNDLTKQFGVRKAVDGLSFDLDAGAFLSVFGPNGAGKTTLLRMLAALSRPTSGTILIDGIDVLEHPEEIRGRVGMISHESMLYPDLSAEENLIFYGQLYGVTDPSVRAKELLDAVGLKHRRMDRVRTFSRGMVQRVSIARALMHDPEIVLLDEPYAGLDPQACDVFDSLIEEVREGRTFCMVSHDFDKGVSLATHILVMRAGREVLFAARDEVSTEELANLYRESVGRGVA